MHPRILHIKENGNARWVMQAHLLQFLKAFGVIGFHSHLQLADTSERSKHHTYDPIPIIGHFPTSMTPWLSLHTLKLPNCDVSLSLWIDLHEYPLSVLHARRLCDRP